MAAVVVAACDLTVNPQPTLHLLHQEHATIAFGAEVEVTSEFPLSSLRYNDNTYLDGGTPILSNGMVVVVKSDCPDVPLAINHSRNGDGHVTTVSIIKATGAHAFDIDDLSFLDPISSFDANWNYTSYWCEYNNQNGFATPPKFDESEVPTATNNHNIMEEDTSRAYSSPWTSARSNLPTTVVMTLLTGSLITAMFGPGPAKTRSSVLFILTTATLVLALVLATEQEIGTGGKGEIDAASHPGVLLANTEPKVGTGEVGTRPSGSGEVDAGSRPDGDSDNTGEVDAGNRPNGGGTGEVSSRPESGVGEVQTRPTLSTICKVNVEILHDGCRWEPLNVQAPSIRIADVVLEDEDSETVNCTTYYEANLTFPLENSTVLTPPTAGSFLTLAQVDGSQCSRAIEGRPFVDQRGHHLLASLQTPNDSDNMQGWSSSVAKNTSHMSEQVVTAAKQQRRQALGEEWARRGLGEHASVASFAAFTMALMANGAPPDLIDASLVAARDEVRHAQESFEIASHFLGKPVEPGSLPPSAHRFENNLTGLALATAQEGCIDETLSALIMASEVDHKLHEMKMFLSDKEGNWLGEKMTAIAMEEASHSALAWQTIQWVCGHKEQESACDAVNQYIFRNNTTLQRRPAASHANYSSNREIEEAMNNIRHTLTPYVLFTPEKATTTEQPQLMETTTTTRTLPQDDNTNQSLVQVVSQQIIQGVMDGATWRRQREQKT